MPTRRFVLFGTNGFIGRNLSAYLSKLSLSNIRLSRSGVDAIAADLRYPDQYIDILKDGDIAIMLASATNIVTRHNCIETEKTANVSPYATFLRAIENLTLTRLIYISSGGTVYGPNSESRSISESSALHPSTPYGWGKARIEQLMVDFSQRSNTPVTILRPSNAVGYGQLASGVGFVAAAVNAAETGILLKIAGGGSIVRDYFDVEDLCRAIVLTSLRHPPTGAAINIGSGVGRTQLEVVNTVELRVGRKIRTQFLPRRADEIMNNVLCVSRAKEILGWTPSITFEESVKRLAAYGTNLK